MKISYLQGFAFAAVLSMSTPAVFASTAEGNTCHSNARGFRILPKRGVAANPSKPETLVRTGGEKGVASPGPAAGQSAQSSGR